MYAYAQVGDGDLGVSLTRATDALLQASLPLHDCGLLFVEIAGILRAAMGGASGPLLSGTLLAQ